MTRSASGSPVRRYRNFGVFWLLLFVVALCAALFPQPATATTTFILPTVPGERWRIIQGYACGTHNAWDRYSLDLAQVDGPTYNAPIRAALGGRVWHWQLSSGTLILSHGNRLFTMYTHLSRAVTTQRGAYFEAGQVLGYAGDRGSPGVPHLHFTAYTANSDGWSGRQSVALRFAEGYDLPEVGGCNQHGGRILVASSLRDPEIHFSSEAQPGTWYNTSQRIEFTSEWSGGGLSQAWNVEPATNAPQFPGAFDGYAELADAGEGMHTFYVRVWGPDGRQSLASFGPLGYDVTPPPIPAPIADIEVIPSSVVVAWQPVSDPLSGTHGYRVYIGPDAAGTATWFTSEPFVKTEQLQPGEYYVRVQSIDQVNNKSEWATLGMVVVTSGE
ncbi:MAG: peptidase M23 [Candidatus Viridilinea halotolerans]|uniref:Peptidase M23 n=1 Tax=Candidatus Viridilinea halotolerans TaxID=2491704 RepID=A0A426TRC8_9CHLR|nr:MAG: peptidase M23 [Candidatus Viridilinea halotolerans]